MSAKPWRLSRLRTWWGLGNACSGEMWSPFAESPPRSVAPASTRSTHQSLRFGGIWIPTSGISLRDSATSRFISSSVTSLAQSGIGSSSPSGEPSPVQRSSVAASAISATSRP